jgi:hypothetical protein
MQAYLELGDSIEDTVSTISDGCFERFWTWPAPKDMGRVRHRYSLSVLASASSEDRSTVFGQAIMSTFLEPQSKAWLAAENVRVRGDLATDAIQIKSIALIKRQTS